MKRSILRALALCLTTAFAAGSAWAQADNNKSQGDRLPGSTPPGGLGTGSAASSSGTRIGSYSSQAGQSVQLSKLMNTTLKGQTGDSLGQVQDVVIDPISGQIQFVVLQLGSGVAGSPGASSATATRIGTSPTATTPGTASTTAYGTAAGGNLVAIPWRLLSHGSGDQFTATVDRTTLQSAPTFSSSAWPTMDSAWMQQVYAHFGIDATSTGVGAPGRSSGTGTGVGNPSTPGLPSTPGTPDINPPPTATPGTAPGTGTGPGGK